MSVVRMVGVVLLQVGTIPSEDVMVAWWIFLFNG